MQDRHIILIAHNIRSAHNVGSLFRTADGIGVDKLYLSGYTPYPRKQNDDRLPHESDRATKQINKTALDAILSVDWEHHEFIETVFTAVHQQGYRLCGLEQSPDAIPVNQWSAPNKVAILLGSEVEGIELQLQKACHELIEIPMTGKKESFNVVQAAAMIMYRLRFLP